MIGAIILTGCLIFREIIRYFFSTPPKKVSRRVSLSSRKLYPLVINSMLVKAPLYLKASSFTGLSMITYGILTPGSNGSPIGLVGFSVAFCSGEAILGSLQSQGAQQAEEGLL
jgi:hypothetical protein